MDTLVSEPNLIPKHSIGDEGTCVPTMSTYSVNWLVSILIF